MADNLGPLAASGGQEATPSEQRTSYTTVFSGDSRTLSPTQAPPSSRQGQEICRAVSSEFRPLLLTLQLVGHVLGSNVSLSLP